LARALGGNNVALVTGVTPVIVSVGEEVGRSWFGGHFKLLEDGVLGMLAVLFVAFAYL
jgi:hypothetical protein